MERRRTLTAVTAAVGVCGVIAAAIPFVDSWEPSARARAGGAPVKIDLRKLEPGQMIAVQWRKRPVWILHRTAAQVDDLPKLNGRLKDPLSRQPQQPPGLSGWNPVQRSIRPEFLVAVGICTHLGCIPKYRPTSGSAELGAGWPGGFFCPCHGSRYDLAGRVMDGSPAPLNLPVIPHYYERRRVLVAGEMANGSQQSWSPKIW
ncbi:MAG: ubiquinol-cytochrome c reductase iron-sulfur subunit [Steroidobacteraceae bacterium]